MKKSVLTGLMALAAIAVNAQEPTYNFFDPADCDEEGWLWLDSAEKMAKYVGEGKKIQLINAQYEIEDPDYKEEYIIPQSVADATVEGYNTKGEKGGEGSKTGGFILPLTDFSNWRPALGGGILVQMPDCATFDLYMSQEKPNVYTCIEGARGYAAAADCQYIWNDADPSDWYPNDKPLSTEYVAFDLNIQNYFYDLTFQGGDAPDSDNLMIYGPKGEPRTAAIYNYSEECPMIVQGIRVFTFTDVSQENNSVEDVLGGNEISINGKSIVLSAPAEINVYNAAGVKVASANAASLDCSALNGVYIVKAAGKTIKAVF